MDGWNEDVLLKTVTVYATIPKMLFFCARTLCMIPYEWGVHAELMTERKAIDAFSADFRNCGRDCNEKCDMKLFASLYFY